MNHGYTTDFVLLGAAELALLRLPLYYVFDRWLFPQHLSFQVNSSRRYRRRSLHNIIGITCYKDMLQSTRESPYYQSPILVLIISIVPSTLYNLPYLPWVHQHMADHL
ncbi:hypothetical protein BDW62DRAFT_189084, partial [Aspergillus aurantiobrunneus]